MEACLALTATIKGQGGVGEKVLTSGPAIHCSPQNPSLLTASVRGKLPQLYTVGAGPLPLWSVPGGTVKKGIHGLWSSIRDGLGYAGLGKGPPPAPHLLPLPLTGKCGGAQVPASHLHDPEAPRSPPRTSMTLRHCRGFSKSQTSQGPLHLPLILELDCNTVIGRCP